MTNNHDFTTKKRVRMFVYEFDGYYTDPSTEKAVEISIKEEGGFYVILASLIVILSLLILGLDLAISPITGLRHLVSSAMTRTQEPDFSRMDANVTRESITRPRDFRDPFRPAQDRLNPRRENNGLPYHESTRQSVRRHHNSPVSHETSFSASSNLRPREYWL